MWDRSTMKKEGLRLLESAAKMMTCQTEKAKQKWFFVATHKFSELPNPSSIRDKKNTSKETWKLFLREFARSAITEDISLASKGPPATVRSFRRMQHTVLSEVHQNGNEHEHFKPVKEGFPQQMCVCLESNTNVRHWNAASHRVEIGAGGSRSPRWDRVSDTHTTWISNVDRSIDCQTYFVDLRDELQRRAVEVNTPRLPRIAQKHYERLLRLKQEVRDEQVVKRRRNPSLPPGPPSLRSCRPRGILPDREARKRFQPKKEVWDLVQSTAKPGYQRWEGRIGNQCVLMKENEPMRFRFHASHALNTNRSLKESRALFYLTGSDNPRKRKLEHLITDEV
ncbi:hypothetical protein FGB62_92g031 [Gracilaria domingensis]|nr:hypothetical protein FGB62_92g031 [Gracilaria domingensis]